MTNVIYLSDNKEWNFSSPQVSETNTSSKNIWDTIKDKAYNILANLGLVEHHWNTHETHPIRKEMFCSELHENVTRLDMTQKYCDTVRSFFPQWIWASQSLRIFFNSLLNKHHHIMEYSIVPWELKTLIIWYIAQTVSLLNSQEAQSFSRTMLDMIDRYSAYGNPWVFIYTRETIQNYLKTIEDISVPELHKDWSVVNFQTRNTPDFSSLSSAFYRPYTEKPRHIANQDS